MSTSARSLAVFGHPGHELRLLHALRALDAPCVLLTDGSAGEGRSRTAISESVLSRFGCPAAPEFVSVPDARLYGALRLGDARVFAELVDRLAGLFDAWAPDRLITDSAEGYNPVHDLYHFAVLEAAKRGRRDLPVFEIALNHDPRSFAHARPEDCLVFSLDRPALEAKLDAMRAYIAAAGPGLAGEAQELLERDGEQGQGLEILRPALECAAYDAAWTEEAPFFEQHGLKRVREGKYAEALTLSGHLAPALDAMLAKADDFACAS
jgi:hypothetical protein